MKKSIDYYNLLGISIFASPEEIKAAYINKMKTYHPDTYAGNKKEAENITAGINEGYAILSDPKQKEVYDKKYGFDVQRQNILFEQEKLKRKQARKAKKQNQTSYATEKAQAEEARQHQEFNKATEREDAKPKTNFFTKKLKKDIKATNPFAKPEEKKQENKERLILDCAIIVLLIIVIVLIIFK